MDPRSPLGVVPRQAAGLAGMAVLVAVVVLGVFVYVSRLAPVDATPPATATNTPGVRAAVTRPIASPTRPGVAGPMPASPHSGGRLLTYRDEVTGFTMDLDSSWHRLATADEPDAAEGRTAVFVDESTGARLAVTAWSGRSDALPNREWIDDTAPGMSSVDGRWPTEAMVSGSPAIILWADEAPDAPARYATFARHGWDLVRISYAANDGGALLNEYARALVSLEWSDADTTDLIPPLPRPAGRYFPPATGAQAAP